MAGKTKLPADMHLNGMITIYIYIYFLTRHFFSLRGAELVDEHVRAQLEAVRREDKGKMDRIKKS